MRNKTSLAPLLATAAHKGRSFARQFVAFLLGIGAAAGSLGTMAGMAAPGSQHPFAAGLRFGIGILEFAGCDSVGIDPLGFERWPQVALSVRLAVGGRDPV